MSRRKRILVVEDDVDLRRMIRHVLVFAGYDIIEAADGMAALRALDTHPDGVILDLGLPLVSGEVVSQEIAAHAHTRDIPVIVVTGQPGDHAGLPVACVLRKPVATERLIETVRACLGAGAAGFSTS
jgi:two-component system, OmpR family, phosphate regulon response regulator PhoB